MSILEARTERVKVGDTLRYATPLPRVRDVPPLMATPETIMPMLRSTERRLIKDPAKAKVHKVEIQKLIDGGCVTKQFLHGAATDPSLPQSDLRDTESLLLQRSQAECFQEEIECLKAGKPVKPGSKLSMLSPEIDFLCYGISPHRSRSQLCSHKTPY